MAENTVSQVVPIVNESVLDFIEQEGNILFSAEEIGRQLGYKKPAKSVNILFNRNQKELAGYAVGIKLMSTDGKYYEVRHFTEEGVYILSMLANTPHAAQFRAKVASLLRQVREQQLSQSYQQGLSDARALPASEAERKLAFLEGMAEGRRLQKRQDPLQTAHKAVDYMRKGLTLAEASILTGCAPSTLRGRIRKMREAVAALQPRMVQGCLL